LNGGTMSKPDLRGDSHCRITPVWRTDNIAAERANFAALTLSEHCKMKNESCKFSRNIAVHQANDSRARTVTPLKHLQFSFCNLHFSIFSFQFPSTTQTQALLYFLVDELKYYCYYRRRLDLMGLGLLG
jgi:hypothetical protein